MEKIRILEFKSFEKPTLNGKKFYYTIKLYIDFCEAIITCFVDKKIFEDIESGKINDKNIFEYLHYKVDKDMNFHVFIK